MTVVDKQALAVRLTGRKRSETQHTISEGQTLTYQTVAASDSHDGVVLLEPFGEFISAEDDAYVEVDTTIVVKKGDNVYVTLYGGSIGKSMLVTGVIGRGDQQKDEVDTKLADADSQLDAHQSLLEALQDVSEDMLRANSELGDYIDVIHSDLIDFETKIGGYITMDGDVIELGSSESTVKHRINSDGDAVINTDNGAETIIAQFGEDAILPNIETNYIRMGDMVIVKRTPADGTHIAFKGV